MEDIWIAIRDGYYKIRATKHLNISAESFFLNGIMDRQFAGIMGDTKSINAYERNISTLLEGDVICQEMTKEDLPNSDAGYIYLCGSFDAFKACTNEDTILIQLITTVNQNLDIVISPRQFIYNLPDIYDVDPKSPMMWLMSQPNPIAPSDLVTEEYVDKNAMKWASYT